MIDPYLDPATGTLRNKLGITDEAQLQRAEAQITLAKMVRLEQQPPPGKLDLEHLQAIHKELFEDIYPWAGQIRTVNVAKADMFCPVQNIPSFAGDIFRNLAKDNHLQGLDQESFTGKAAELLGDLNALHPFREGNGRTQRAFLTQIASQAGYAIDWSNLDSQQNLEASIASFRGDNRPLAAMLRPRISATQPEADNASPGSPAPQQARLTSAADHPAPTPSQRLASLSDEALAAHRANLADVAQSLRERSTQERQRAEDKAARFRLDGGPVASRLTEQQAAPERIQRALAAAEQDVAQAQKTARETRSALKKVIGQMGAASKEAKRRANLTPAQRQAEQTARSQHARREAAAPPRQRTALPVPPARKGTSRKA